MSEEIKMSAFEAFKQTQQTFAEAEEKAKKEAGVPKVERFRIGTDGEYPIRILPLAPTFDAEGNILPMDRKGYEYPLHQLFLAIKAPAKKDGKVKKINIPVIRTTDKEVGYSVDLIDTYVKIAKEMYGDDEELMKRIGDSSYNNGLRWGYQHSIMVLDVSSDKERAKGPQLYQCSHSVYKDIDAAKMRLWKELREDGGQETCPISGFTNAFPVKIVRSTVNKKTEYKVDIARKPLDITEEEAMKLIELPRIPESIYRYNRYSMEATIEFLQQYDQELDIEVCKQTDFLDAVKKLEGELPPDDKSHFTLSGSSKKESADTAVTIDTLWDEYDYIIDQELSDKSDEYQEHREKIRQFIESNNLDVRISRSKTNQQLLDEVQEAIESTPATPAKEEESEPEPPVTKKRAPKPKPAPVEEPEEDQADDEPEEEDFEEDESEEEEPVEETPRRRRAARPGSEAAAKEEEPVEEEGEEEPEEPAPVRRRLHGRRR